MPAISLGAAYFANRSAKKQSQQSQQKLDTTTTALQGSAKDLSDTGTNLIGQGKNISAPGFNNLGAAAGYYSPIVQGSRASIQQSLAPERSLVSDYYRGATKGLERSGMTGGSKDLATAELARDKAAKLSGLAPAARRDAAQGLAGVGSQQVQAGLATTGQGVNAKQTGASVLSPVYAGQNYRAAGDMDYYRQTGQGIGGMLFDTLKAGSGTKKSPLPSSPSTSGFPGFAQSVMPNRP
jgi:hypothetical protein